MAKNPPASATSKSKLNKATGAPSEQYPRFRRRGDHLVKVGYSRRLREEYRHKAPWATVESVSAAVANVGGGGRMFTPDQFIPVREAGAQTDIPIYQIYLALAWLRSLGLVKVHGRSGYTLNGVSNGELTAEAKLAWARVAEGD